MKSEQGRAMSFGIVGAGGYWGPNWVRVLDHLGVLGAVCEKDPERLKEVHRRLPMPKRDTLFTESYDELLSRDLDAVFIVTPPRTHEAMAIKAMNSGKHVFIEKPLADSQEQCYRIKFEAERLDRIVMVGHTFIYHPAVQLFKEMLSKIGKLRTIFTVRGNFGLYQEAGLVNDLLPHDLSIFTYLCEGYPSQLKSDVNPYQDIAFVTAKYGDVICSAFLSWAYPEKTRKLLAVGNKGILEWDLSWSYINLYHKWAKQQDGGFFEHTDNGTSRIEVTELSEPLMNEALHFMDCIRDGTEPLTGIEDGINVVKGLELCR